MADTENPHLDFLVVWTRDDSTVRVLLSEEPMIDAAVTAYLDSGRQRDQLLHIETPNGVPYVSLVSEITSWMRCTVESRATVARLEEALAIEEKDNYAWRTIQGE